MPPSAYETLFSLGTYDPSPSVVSVLPTAQGPLLGSFHFKFPPFTAMISLADNPTMVSCLWTPLWFCLYYFCDSVKQRSISKCAYCIALQKWDRLSTVQAPGKPRYVSLPRSILHHYFDAVAHGVLTFIYLFSVHIFPSLMIVLLWNTSRGSFLRSCPLCALSRMPLTGCLTSHYVHIYCPTYSKV